MKNITIHRFIDGGMRIVGVIDPRPGYCSIANNEPPFLPRKGDVISFVRIDFPKKNGTIREEHEVDFVRFKYNDYGINSSIEIVVK